jgi:cysteine desulfurase
VGKIQVNPRSVGVHLLALSAHKIYGPKGVGALYVSRRSPRVKLTPLIHGGGHEGGMRSGTLNAPGIVGLGMAMELASGWISEYQMVVRAIRDQLETELLKMPSAFVNGSMENRLPHVSNLRFEGINASSLMTSLSRELAVASGSACTSADPEPSHVLQAMGFSTDQAKASLRFSLGRQNTIEEIAQTVEMVKKKLADVRSDSML